MWHQRRIFSAQEADFISEVVPSPDSLRVDADRRLGHVRSREPRATSVSSTGSHCLFARRWVEEQLLQIKFDWLIRLANGYRNPHLLPTAMIRYMVKSVGSWRDPCSNLEELVHGIGHDLLLDCFFDVNVSDDARSFDWLTLVLLQGRNNQHCPYNPANATPCSQRQGNYRRYYPEDSSLA